MDARILVVDDEPEIADLVEVYLKSEGCTVFKCGTGTEALAVVRNQALDLAILDVMLPDISGFTLCGEIRKEHHFPVLMLTAKAEDMDKITGLTIGADDYITKPFNPLELMARVKAQLRRYTRYNEADKAGDCRDIIDFNGLVINRPPTSVPSTTGSWASPPLSLTFSGCSVRTGARSSPPSGSLRACGGRNTWTAIIRLWFISAACGKKWASPPAIPGSSRPSGASATKSTNFFQKNN